MTPARFLSHKVIPTLPALPPSRHTKHELARKNETRRNAAAQMYAASSGHTAPSFSTIGPSVLRSVRPHQQKPLRKKQFAFQ